MPRMRCNALALLRSAGTPGDAEAVSGRMGASCKDEKGVRSLSHQRRFFANARPEPDFKYFSNATACFSSLNAT